MTNATEIPDEHLHATVKALEDALDRALRFYRAVTLAGVADALEDVVVGEGSPEPWTLTPSGLGFEYRIKARRRARLDARRIRLLLDLAEEHDARVEFSTGDLENGWEGDLELTIRVERPR